MESREIRVIDIEGQRVFGVLHLPKGEGPFPVVLVHHGFGGNKVGTGRIYVQQAEALAREGIATFRFDFRGCGDSEGNFDQVTIETLVTDALHVIESLRGEPLLDVKRLGLLGCSLGGSVACLVAEQAMPSSVALWAPVAQGELWHEQLGDLPAEELFRSGGAAPSAEFCEQFLALMADQVVGKLDIPLLHAHGDRDTVVHPNHADHFANARGEGMTSHFVRLPNSCHGFSHEAERTQLIAETVAWFSETL